MNETKCVKARSVFWHERNPNLMPVEQCKKKLVYLSTKGCKKCQKVIEGEKAMVTHPNSINLKYSNI